MPTRFGEFRFTPAASENMETIWLYSLREWNLEQADQNIADLTLAFRRLAAYPKTGLKSDNIRIDNCKSLVNRYVIYLKETHYKIQVVRILHDRILPLRHLP